MPLDDLAETLKDLAIRVHLVQIPLGQKQRVRELMKELVKLRKQRNIGQKPIAEAIGVTQGRISQMENSNSGNLTMEAVLVYARTIGAVIVVMPEEGGKTD